MQVPELRLVWGDILRQDVAQLLVDMRAHAQQRSGQQQADEQHGPAAQQQQPPPQQHEEERQQLVAEQQHAAEAAGAAAGPQAGLEVTVKVVANLPYYITKDCLVQMLPLGGDISALYFMLQVLGVQGAHPAGVHPAGCIQLGCIQLGCS